MSETETNQDTTNEVEAVEEDKLNEIEAVKVAQQGQFGQSGDVLDTTIGNMGGMGASATGPDITKQSEPAPGNHADLPADQR